MGIVSADSPCQTVDSAALRDLGDVPSLVLGGGGLKGLAHVGVWRVLTEADVRPAGIIGTSIGALVGALAASGTDWQDMWQRALALEKSDIVRVNRRVAPPSGSEAVRGRTCHWWRQRMHHQRFRCFTRRSSWRDVPSWTTEPPTRWRSTVRGNRARPGSSGSTSGRGKQPIASGSWLRESSGCTNASSRS